MKSGLSLIALALAVAAPSALHAQEAPADKTKAEKAEDVTPQVHTTKLSGTFGGQKINLRPVEATQQEWWTGAAGGVPGTADLCFIVTVDAEQIIAHLQECGVAVAQGPVPKAGALGPITSVYCRDPDGNLIEISTYGAPD